MCEQVHCLDEQHYSFAKGIKNSNSLGGPSFTYGEQSNFIAARHKCMEMKKCIYVLFFSRSTKKPRFRTYPLLEFHRHEIIHINLMSYTT